MIQSAGQGDEAKHLILEAAADNAPFDLVITDLIMPKVDGWQLVQWIQENHPRIATIILTGLGENGLGHLKLRPNMDLRSIKTLTPQQLMELIHQLDKTLQDNAGMVDDRKTHSGSSTQTWITPQYIRPEKTGV